jgi:hypothetical protein
MSLNFADVTSQSCYARFFTCRKTLRHEASGFTSHPKEGLLRIFIVIKNLSPQPGLSPRPLGPVVSTLTSTGQMAQSGFLATELGAKDKCNSL